MKTKKIRIRQGFTIVELVIVIGVVGVLAAVLIPTFINLNSKANQAADESLIKNLNTQLRMKEADEGKNKTMTEALADALEAGYKVENLTPKAGKDIVWDQEKDEFTQKESVPTDGTAYKFWTIAKSAGDLAKGYSPYLYFEPTEPIQVSTGFDVGEYRNISVTYSGNAGIASKAILRMNGGKLIVNDTNPNSEQVFYGNADIVEVTTGTDCFTSHGQIGTMDLKAGKAVADKGAYVGLVKAAEGTVAEEKNGGVFVIPSTASVAEIDDEVASSLGYTVEEDKFVPSEQKASTSYFDIHDVESLIGYRNLINGGVEVPSAKVTANIDMAKVDWIEMIGKDNAHPFTGKLDGQGHTIANLSNGDRMTSGTYTSPTSKTVGKIFGLFGYVGGSVDIFNLKLSVDADVPEGKSCGGIIAVASKNATITLSTITVSGSLYARDEKAAGIIGTDSGSTITMTNVTNAANIKGKERVSGFISQIASSANVTFNNCHNTGKISLTKVSDGSDYETRAYGVGAGFISHSNGGTISYNEKCTSTGAIDAPLAALYHVRANVVKYTGNNTWITGTGNISGSYETAVEAKGIIMTDYSKAAAKTLETYFKMPNALDGIYYKTDTAYAVELLRRENSDSRISRFTDGEWNDSSVEKRGITDDSTSGTTVKLLVDLNWTDKITAGTSRTITVDLNGHTLTATSPILKGLGATKVIFRNGVISAEGVKLVESGYSSVTFEDSVTGNWAEQ